VATVRTGPSAMTVTITGPGASLEAKVPRKNAERIAAQIRAVPAG
jgi:hypothetical protein